MERVLAHLMSKVGKTVQASIKRGDNLLMGFDSEGIKIIEVNQEQEEERRR